MTLAPARLLALAPLLSGLGGCCSHFTSFVSRYGEDEVAAASQLAPMGSLAYRLCRKEAAYGFALDVQNAESQTPSWPVWYGSQPGPLTPQATLGLKPPTWQQYCDQSSRASDVIHLIARHLAAHGRALAALAEGKPFDTTGLQAAGDTAQSLSSKLGVVGAVPKAAHDAGSAFATAANTIVQLYRERKIKALVVGSDNCLRQTFDDMAKFTEALDDRLRKTEEDESLAVRVLASRPQPPALTRGLVVVESLEVAGGGDRELKDIRLALAAYRDAVDALIAAHQNLAVLAETHGDEGAVARALEVLEANVQAMNELER